VRHKYTQHFPLHQSILSGIDKQPAGILDSYDIIAILNCNSRQSGVILESGDMNEK
jgi:hypothetical protein